MSVCGRHGAVVSVDQDIVLMPYHVSCIMRSLLTLGGVSWVGQRASDCGNEVASLSDRIMCQTCVCSTAALDSD